MYRIAVVDDQEEGRAGLKAFIKRYASERKMAVEIFEFEDGESFLKSFKNNYEIVLLDIEMGGIDGMETARRLREQDENVCLIFVTRLANYAVQGYGVRALDFLVKPVNYENFSLKMDRAVTEAERAAKKEILLVTTQGNVRVRTADIFYVEVMNHTLIYHTKDGDLSVRGSIRDCEEKLAPCDFARCNKSYLVNLYYVTEIRRGEIRVGDVYLPIGTTKKQTFMKQLTEYMGEIVL